ncbi:MAG: universal stress protein [Pseudomonadota bacterium]
MTRGPAPLRHVLAVVDRDMPDAARTAADLAARHGARLGLMAVLEPPRDAAALAEAAGLAPDDLLDRLREDHRQHIREAVARALPDGPAPDIHVAVGKPFVEIVRHVIAADVDIVVKTAEPLAGAAGFLFASTDQHLVRKCPCPVWLRMPEAPAVPRRVLAAVDVDDWDAAEPETLADLNRRVLDTALDLAAGPGATIHALHAWDAAGEGMVWAFSGEGDPRLKAQGYVNRVLDTRRRALDELLRPVRAAGGPEIVPHLVRGRTEAVIAAQAAALDADIVVIGTVARTGLSGVIIGNTAENILNSLDRSVVAVKPGAFVCPLDA